MAAIRPAATSSGASQPGASLPPAGYGRCFQVGQPQPARDLGRRRCGHLGLGGVASAPRASARAVGGARHGLERAGVRRSGRAAATALAAGGELVGEPRRVLLHVRREAVQAVAQLTVAVAARVDAAVAAIVVQRPGGRERRDREPASRAMSRAFRTPGTVARGGGEERGMGFGRAFPAGRVRMPAMAATATRPAGSSARIRARTGDVPPGAAALGVALLVATAYAVFASGAIGVTDQARFQVIVAAIAFGTLAGLLFGRGLRFEPSRGAMLGVGLLVGFAAWCALSITWSIAPDQSWLEANRALSYGLVSRWASRSGRACRGRSSGWRWRTWPSPPRWCLSLQTGVRYQMSTGLFRFLGSLGSQLVQ